MKRIALAIIALCISACSGSGSEPQFIAEGTPKALSEWGQLSLSRNVLTPSEGVTAYDLSSPLFTDYAQKLRTVWIPGNEPAAYNGEDVFDFPVGTVITKTFYYPRGQAAGEVLKSAPTHVEDLDTSTVQLIETRVLARREEGWVALPYVWNAEQTDAVLKRTGDVKRLVLIGGEKTTPFAYIVPNVNQCAGCHAVDSTSRALYPIGPKARHLNKEMIYADTAQNQLAYWHELGLLGDYPDEAPANAVWTDAARSISDRARAYIDINCSHCHSDKGPADTSGLHLTPETPVGPNLGLCKTPIAAGRGTGNREFGIVPGDANASIFSYRMASTELSIMMPELGRTLSHGEGVELIKAWINSLDGNCEG